MPQPRQQEEVPTLFKARVNVTIYTDTGTSFAREVDVTYKNENNPDKNKVYHKILKQSIPKMFASRDVRG